MMVKLEIIRKDNYNYTLKDKNNIIYNFTLVFFDIEQQPQVGDHIYLSNILLDKSKKEYSNSYYFGLLDNSTGRKISDEKSPDLITIQTSERRTTLKRLYG